MEDELNALRQRVEALEARMNGIKSGITDIQRLISQIKYTLLGAVGLFALQAVGLKALLIEVLK